MRDIPEDWMENKKIWHQEKLDGELVEAAADTSAAGEEKEETIVRESLDQKFSDFKGVLWNRGKVFTQQEARFDTDAQTDDSEIKDKFYLIHLGSKKKFILLDKSKKPIDLFEKVSEETDPEDQNFETLWNERSLSNKFSASEEKIEENKIIEFVEVFSSLEELNASTTKREFISREPMLWEREYNILSGDRQKYIIIKENLEKQLSPASDTEQGHAPQLDVRTAVNELASTIVKLRETERKLLNLAAKVSANGFYMSLGERDEKTGEFIIDPTTKKVKIETYDTEGSGNSGTVEKHYQLGRVYRTKKRMHKWTIQKKETWYEYIPEADFKYIHVYKWNESHEKEVIDAEIVMLNADPVTQKINEYEKSNKLVYTLELTKNGFITEEGTPVEDILLQCKLSKKFREQCVIVIPEYSPFITNEEQYLGAFFFENPHEGIFPSRFPSLNITEEVNYNLSWIGQELGQLVNSINLAPGEKRSLELRSSFTRKLSETQDISSVENMSSERSFDLSSEIEKEVSKEQKKTTTKSVSASAGGSFGPVNASGKASYTSTNSIRDFSRNLNKVARKATQKLNKSFEQTIDTSSSLESSVENAKSEKLEIENINLGSTLNLMFYQINNLFEAATGLSSLRFTVNDSREMLQGSGIYNQYTYSLNEINEMLSHFTPDNIPIPLTTTEEADFKNKYKSWLLKVIVESMREYLAVKQKMKCSYGSCEIREEPLLGIESQTISKIQNSGTTLQRRLIPEDEDEADTAGNVETNSEDNVENEILELSEIFSNTYPKEFLINTEVLSVPSGGLYLNSLLGDKPATESYTENMRMLEISDRHTKNMLMKGQASKILSSETGALLPEHVMITNNNEITINLMGQIAGATNLKIYYLGEFVTTAVAQEGNQVTFNWPDDDAEIPSEEYLKVGLSFMKFED